LPRSEQYYPRHLAETFFNDFTQVPSQHWYPGFLTPDVKYPGYKMQP
jgi:hypothetical protein